MNGVTGDLRFAIRSLRRTPAFTLVAIITLSLGLGMAAAAYSVVDTVLIRPLPFAASDGLVLVHASVPPDGSDTVEITYSDAADLAKETAAFASMAIVMTFAGTATALDPPERLEGYDVSVSLFETLGVQPMLGRSFTAGEGEPGKGNVVILGYGFWQRLGGRSDVIGQTLLLDDVPTTIVGVMPRDFRIEVLNNPGAIFRPVTPDHFAAASRAFRAFRAIGRLKDSVTLAQANSVAATVGERLARDHPDTNLGRAFSVRPLHEDVVGNSRASLLMVAGLVAVVLLIAGVNLANLLLARSVARAREMAVRGALGANGWRLAREPIVEGLLLSATSALAGGVVAQAILTAIKTQPGVALPRLAELTIGWNVISAIGLGAIIAAGLVGLVPFLLYRHSQFNATLRSSRATSGTSAARLRSFLVVGQTALAFILLTATGTARRQPAASLGLAIWIRYQRRDDARVHSDGALSNHRRRDALLHPARRRDRRAAWNPKRGIRVHVASVRQFGKQPVDSGAREHSDRRAARHRLAMGQSVVLRGDRHPDHSRPRIHQRRSRECGARDGNQRDARPQELSRRRSDRPARLLRPDPINRRSGMA